MAHGSAAAFGLFDREQAFRGIRDVLADGGSAVAVGEPGAGKSSLLKVAAQLGQRGGRRVLTVTPTQFERGLPFAALAELVAQCPDGAEAGLPGPQRRALDVALRRAEPAGGEVDGLAVPLAVRGLLTYLCEFEAMAIIIDDLQWMDEASSGSLAFALRRLAVEPERLSVLCGARPEGAESDLIRCLPEPRRDLPLAPLGSSAIGQLLRRRLGPRWAPPLSAGVARASGGNPFLALMIAAALDSDAAGWISSPLPGDDPIVPVPPSLTQLLDERVARLPDDARAVLLLVAAGGRLSTAQLQRLVDDTRLRSALESAADADVAAVGAESRVIFTHPLLASAIYDSATPADRRRAHQLLAEELDDPVARARHRSRSIVAPEEAVARELEHAGEISLQRGAPQLAGELFQRAGLATPSGSDTGTGFERWLRSADA